MLAHPATDFASRVFQFCSWAERPARRESAESEGDRARRVAGELRSHFVALYSGALALAQFSFTPGRSSERPNWLDDEALRSSGCVRDLPFQYYWTHLDPLDLARSESVGTGDLCDDVLDIWRELRPPYESWKVGDLDAAAAAWLVGFEAHWGDHIAGALPVLHAFLLGAD